MARVGKKSKTKFKICKELVILVVVLIAMIVTTICLSIPSSSSKLLEEYNNAITAYNSANSTSYATLEEDNVFKKASLNQVADAINDSKGTEEEPKYAYVLYGTLEKAKILEFLSVMNTEAKNREVDTVLFYSSEKVDNQEDKDDESFLAEIQNDEEVFNSSVLAEIDEVDLLVSPAFFVYKNGELVFNSTSGEDTYNWYIMINKAFSL